MEPLVFLKDNSTRWDGESNVLSGEIQIVISS